MRASSCPSFIPSTRLRLAMTAASACRRRRGTTRRSAGSAVRRSGRYARPWQAEWRGFPEPARFFREFRATATARAPRKSAPPPFQHLDFPYLLRSGSRQSGRETSRCGAIADRLAASLENRPRGPCAHRRAHLTIVPPMFPHPASQLQPPCPPSSTPRPERPATAMGPARSPETPHLPDRRGSAASARGGRHRIRVAVADGVTEVATDGSAREALAVSRRATSVDLALDRRGELGQ